MDADLRIKSSRVGFPLYISRFYVIAPKQSIDYLTKLPEKE